MRIYTGFDLHRLKRGGGLYIGGIKVKDDVSAVAHSDGDVLIHSIIDALLSIKSITIGERFPEVMEYKAIASVRLLKTVADELNIKIKQIDSIVFLDGIKIIGFVPQMRKKISGILGVKIDLITIKPKTFGGMLKNAVAALSTVVC